MGGAREDLWASEASSPCVRTFKIDSSSSSYVWGGTRVKPSEQEYAVRTRRAQGRRCVERRTVDPPPLLVPPPAGGREDTGTRGAAMRLSDVCSGPSLLPLAVDAPLTAAKSEGRSSLYSREGMVVVRVKAQRVAPRRERREKALPRPLSTVP